jgi:hypothetical protein
MIYPLTMFKAPCFTVKPPFFRFAHPVALEAVPAASCHRDALICVTNGRIIKWNFNTNGYLVGGIPTPLKNMKVSWDQYSQYIMEK